MVVVLGSSTGRRRNLTLGKAPKISQDFRLFSFFLQTWGLPSSDRFFPREGEEWCQWPCSWLSFLHYFLPKKCSKKIWRAKKYSSPFIFPVFFHLTSSFVKRMKEPHFIIRTAPVRSNYKTLPIIIFNTGDSSSFLASFLYVLTFSSYTHDRASKKKAGRWWCAAVAPFSSHSPHPWYGWTNPPGDSCSLSTRPPNTLHYLPPIIIYVLFDPENVTFCTKSPDTAAWQMNTIIAIQNILNKIMCS